MFVGGGIGDEEEVDDLPSATENDIIENLPTLTSHEQASTEVMPCPCSQNFLLQYCFQFFDFQEFIVVNNLVYW